MPPDIPNIFEAAGNDDVAALEIALQHYDVNVTDENDMTPLHHSSAALAFNTTKRLLDEPNIDTTHKDRFGREAAILPQEIMGYEHPMAEKMFKLIWPSPPEDIELDRLESENGDSDFDLNGGP